jgi:uncharacterized membrane protein YccC
VVGELVSPARWYWAVLTAFVVFAGTNSRGDVLSHGWQRLVGTSVACLLGWAWPSLSAATSCWPC